jgi:Flp pilus assembly protein TadG
MRKKYILPRSAKGQSLVELAISLLILLYLLSGAVEFGIIFFQFVQLRDAVQEGALYGSINPQDATAIEARARAASDKPIDLSDTSAVQITITVRDTAGTVKTTPTEFCEGDAITVQATFNHQVFMPFMSQFIGPTIPLNAEVTDTVLTPVCP